MEPGPEGPSQALQASRRVCQSRHEPEIRLVYEQLAAERKQNNRPYDMAVSDYFQGNDLIWKKLYGDRPKPESWW